MPCGDQRVDGAAVQGRPGQHPQAALIPQFVAGTSSPP